MDQQTIKFITDRSSVTTFMSHVCISFFVFIMTFMGCKNESEIAPVPGAAETTGLEKISLHTMNNDPIDLQQYKGKTVFINFWATWCKPCIKEMPSIQNAKETLNNKDIVFLFATNDDIESVTSFKEENPFDFNYVQVKNLEDLNVQALPTTFIFAPDGTLQFSEAGFRKWDDKESLDLILKISHSNDK